MLKDVRHIITDFGIGASTVKGEGVHVKIGVSTVESQYPFNIGATMTNKTIRTLLGNSPLADACIDSVASGCKTLYAIPVKATVQGTIIEGEKAGTGITLSGNPTNIFDIKIEIINEGDRNSGTFKYYLNDIGSDEYTIPLDGSFEIEDTGLNIEFDAASFSEGDYIIYSTTAPKMSNQGVLEAIYNIRNLNLNFEFFHIVGESTKSLWAALVVEGERFFDIYFKPCGFVCETRCIKPDEKLHEYMQYFREEKKGIVSRNLQVVSARITYTRDGRDVNINAASIIMGLHARARVQQSIGETAVYDIKGATKLLPEGIEDYISDLDDLGYTTLREYVGIEGIFVNNSRTFAQEGSDYAYTERVRAMYKAVRETRKTALLRMHTQVDIDNLEASLKAIVEFINVPVERMVSQKELSSARVEIPEGQDILGTEKLYYKIRAVPIGILREIEIDVGFENPIIRKE